MCGIAGFWATSRSGELIGTVRQMTDAISHRGPDAEGHWVDDRCGVALGHRRLSIVELSDLGAQPMHSASSRFVLAFNGEIYNYRDIREELAGRIPLRGHSDTEVLLAGIEVWGLEQTLGRAAGMFAFALFDREHETLYLGRDRIGEKPLYYGNVGGALLFGSELKGLRAHPHFSGTIDRDALSAYLSRAYVPAPRSIYKEIRKVRPGTFLAFSRAGGLSTPVETTYWSPEDAVRKGIAAAPESDEELLAEFEAILRRSIGEQMVADVPVGAFLSGGIDSSLVVSIMQAQSARKVRTFTIGFHEKKYNEAEHARQVAAHLGTDHTELYVTPADALSVIPSLPTMYDEPFADSSQIPTALLAALTRKHVTVSLSGDGADELFGGYSRYFLGERLSNKLAPVPHVMRSLAARAIRGVPAPQWDRLARAMGGIGPRSLTAGSAGDRLHKLADLLEIRSPETLYDHLISSWPRDHGVVIGASSAGLPASNVTRRELGGFALWMMYSDLIAYLPDDIMVKVDRASMAVALELRAPFLDHRMVEFAWRVPMRAKMRDGVGKHIMRTLLYRHVPKELIDRPKMGFGVPINEWLRGPLREWAEDLLDERKLTEEAFFMPAEIRQKWEEHRTGARNWQAALWPVLMFQAWRRQQ